jgi:hypothetical protein
MLRSAYIVPCFLTYALMLSACEQGRVRSSLDPANRQIQKNADSGPNANHDSGNATGGQTDSGHGATIADGGSSNPGSQSDAGPGGSNPNPGTIGASCAMDSECGHGPGSCLTGQSAWWNEAWQSGYCTMADCSTDQNPCPNNGVCVSYDEQMNTTCLSNCGTDNDCRSGYFCHEVGGCLPGPSMMTGGGGTGTSPVGSACMADADCSDSGASCITEQTSPGFVGGYCTVFSCTDSSPCPSGSDCYTVNSSGTTACLANCQQRSQCRGSAYACYPPGACMPACDANSCDPGEVCGGDGLCVSAPCSPGSCATGLICDQSSGQCVVDVGTPPSGSIPTCNNLPDWRCSATSATPCSQLVPFEPITGPGYWNYPLNGETTSDQYRSYLRYDFTRLLKFASASVDCLAANWTVGNGHPIGLGDMSESNGSIPGTRENSPGHPPGTHEQGHDIDIAYYQLSGTNNWLRAVCSHTSGGADQYHCVNPPNNLDIWRTALFIGKIHETAGLRVIGVDGQIGTSVESAITQLCARGWLSNGACSNPKLAYEVTNMNRGWFQFHHHHMHVSISSVTSLRSVPPEEACLIPNNCGPAQHDLRPLSGVQSQAFESWSLPSRLNRMIRQH